MSAISANATGSPKIAAREVQAAGRRDVVWYFAEQDAADHARDLFAKKGNGRENIIIKTVSAVSPRNSPFALQFYVNTCWRVRSDDAASVVRCFRHYLDQLCDVDEALSA